MSDRVHRTVRPTLPEGYQYGDAAKTPGRMLTLFIPTCFGFSVPIPTLWPSHEHAAAQLKRKAYFDERIAGMSRSYDIDAKWPPHAQRTGDETL